MPTMKEHFKSLHAKEAEHHLAAAKLHKQLAKCFGKAEGMESTGDIAAAHEGLAQQHLDLSEFHLECCKSLDSSAKAMGGDDNLLNRIVPDNVSAVHGDAPESAFSRDGIRPVFRAGQREFSSSEVAPGFEKLVSIEDSD